MLTLKDFSIKVITFEYNIFSAGYVIQLVSSYCEENVQT